MIHHHLQHNHSPLLMQLPFIHGHDVKQCGETMANIVEQLPDPDIEAIGYVDNPQAELLHWHYHLNHLTFRVLKSIATNGILQRRLVSAREPKCAVCIFFGPCKKGLGLLMHRYIILGQYQAFKKLAQCVSVDQMIFSELGFIAQLKGSLNRARYMVIAVYVDHFSMLCFIYFEEMQTSAETLESKNAFEAFCRQHSPKVCHY